MVGSHKSGVLNSKNIYSKMLITFSFMMMHVMLNRLKVTNIVINYICKIYNNIAQEHDYVTGVVSHIPHIIASSLVHLSETNSKNHTLVTQLAVALEMSHV